MKKFTLLSTVVFLLFILSACTISISTDSDKDTAKTPSPEIQTPAVTEQKFVKVSEDERNVFYNGEVTVSGKYQELSPNGPFIGEQLCFYVDTDTKYLIPRENGDTRNAWFCFKDQEKAKVAFGIDDKKAFADSSVECIQGKATIQISDYVVDKLEAEVFDTASLVKVVSKDEYTNSCND